MDPLLIVRNVKGVMQGKMYELNKGIVSYVRAIMNLLFCFKHMEQGR